MLTIQSFINLHSHYAKFPNYLSSNLVFHMWSLSIFNKILLLCRDSSITTLVKSLLYRKTIVPFIKSTSHLWMQINVYFYSFFLLLIWLVWKNSYVVKTFKQRWIIVNRDIWTVKELAIVRHQTKGGKNLDFVDTFRPKDWKNGCSNNR